MNLLRFLNSRNASAPVARNGCRFSCRMNAACAASRLVGVLRKKFLPWSRGMWCSIRTR